MLAPLLLALACSGAKAPSPPTATIATDPGPRLRFSALPAPQPQPDGSTLLASATLDGQDHPFGWQVLIAEGDQPGDSPHPFGTLIDARGGTLPFGKAPTCPNVDGNGLFELEGRIWLLSNQECAPAALYQTELNLSEGRFSAVRTRPVDLSAIGGTNQLCAAEVPRPGTYLTAEEYEPDASRVSGRSVDLSGTTSSGKSIYDASDWVDFLRFAGEATPSPYSVGWMVEVQTGADGGTTARKRTAMGRFSHELSRTMPDGRTVFLSDDYSHGILAMFVADRAWDNASGRLYAARWTESAGQTTLRWVDLGAASEAEVDAAIARGIRFDELLLKASPGSDGTCPTGTTAVRSPQGVDECLSLRPGQERLASRLETRRTAALLGATVEFQKEEGVAFDPSGRRLFVAFTQIAAGMLPQDPPSPEADHIRLPANPCGVVYAFALSEGQTDTAGAPIDSAWVPTTATPAVSGVPLAEGCDPAWPSEPDNLEWLPAAQALLIAEDTDRSPNLLWAWQGGAPLPLLAGPPRPAEGRLAEIAGLSVAPSVGGQSWVTVSIQHPGGQPARVGVLGPFPAVD